MPSERDPPPKDAAYYARHYAAQGGWPDDTLIDALCAYLDEVADLEDLADFLSQRVGEEFVTETEVKALE
jgi:hypothetical protein